MTSRSNPGSEGMHLASRIRRQLGSDIHEARLSAGLSQESVGAAAGISHAQVGRIERGELRRLTVEQACRAGLAVGLRLGARLYPDGDPVRDRGQLALLERFRTRLPPGARWDTEVPLPLSGDRRAWDALLRLGGQRAGCEGETRLADIQALERRLALKFRDGGVDVLLLIVADTQANRRALAAHRDELRSLLPLDGRQVLGALRAGRLPQANGLVVL